MKRMFLVSMFQNVSDILETVGLDLKNKTVTYIPTASRAEKLGFFVRIGKWRLKRLGLSVDELEISTAPYEVIVSKLEKNDYIYVTGGNTFFLLQELRRTGADKILAQEIEKGKFYIGESAGAIVVAPDIGYSAKMDRIEKAPGLKSYEGLNLIDFYVVPHYKNWEMGKAAEDFINTYSDSLELKSICDNQAILIENSKVQILGKPSKK
ncbi:Type 1 glutamine amidotransferase-like domain-containing protein [Faecalicatena orotica]|nr:Type 1 glutamine amidotransferase-like domain-containing protein [Faecalicatena orotica]